MKRRYLALLLLLTCLIPLHALKVTHLHIGMGNDWYTMGLGNNFDDGLSYGAHLSVVVEDKAFLKVDALGFTDKKSSGYRYDQVNINLYSPLNLFLGGISYTLTPLVGITLEGDFAFEKIQNNVHRNLNILELNLIYDNAGANAHLNLGSTINAMLPLGWMQIGLEASYLHSFAWENSLQTVAVLKLGNSLTLKGGYSLLHDMGEGNAHHMMMDRFSGQVFSYYFDGGLITNSWVYHKDSGSSYGVFGVDVMQLFQPATYTHSDFTYSFGALYDKFGHMNRFFSLGFGPIILHSRHKSGPMRNDDQTPRRRMTVASWMIGYQKEWEATDLVHPYLTTSWGIQRFNLQKDLTSDLIETVKPTVALEIGILFGKEGQWVTKSSTYRPRIATSIQYVFDTKELKNMDPSFAEHVGPWILLIGVALDIGHDPH